MSHQRTSRRVPERFLRQLWKHQQFDTSHLRVVDGRPVKILSPGILNNDGGPDYTDAHIRINGTLYRGDVELHQQIDEWTAHAHHRDPKYNRVILHVVLHGEGSFSKLFTESNRPLPVLILGEYLQTSYHSTWKSMIHHERADRQAVIPCHTANDAVDASVIQRWLRKLAIERIELKVRRFEERLKEMVEQYRLVVHEAPPRYDEIPFGINPEDLPPPTTTYTQRELSPLYHWKQLLYEGVMEALGYSKNQEPMLELARCMTLSWLEGNISSEAAEGENATTIEASLLGGAGLLPMIKELNDPESKTRVRLLQRKWKQIKKRHHSKLLCPVEWQFFRLRPENFPTIRVAGAARLILRFSEAEFFKSLIQTVKNNEAKEKEKFRALESLFIVPADMFWKEHYLFGEKANNNVQVCIGSDRANDIILNVVIPVSLLYARIFKDRDVRSGALALFEYSPARSDNSIIRVMKQQLVKSKCSLTSSMQQQGALQLYKRYCLEKRCAECAVGKVVFLKSP